MIKNYYVCINRSQHDTYTKNCLCFFVTLNMYKVACFNTLIFKPTTKIY